MFRGNGFYEGVSEVDVLYANVAATYAQPTAQRVHQQALVMWDVMYSVLSKEAPASVLSGSQVWTKYSLVVQTRVSDITTFAAAWDAVKSDEDKKRAWNVFMDSVRFRVFDHERQFVDQKDFVNKNFAP